MEKTTSIYSPHVLIVEGIFALYDRRVLDLLDMKVRTLSRLLLTGTSLTQPTGLLRSRRGHLSVTKNIERRRMSRQKCGGRHQTVVYVG